MPSQDVACVNHNMQSFNDVLAVGQWHAAGTAGSCAGGDGVARRLQHDQRPADGHGAALGQRVQPSCHEHPIGRLVQPGAACVPSPPPTLLLLSNLACTCSSRTAMPCFKLLHNAEQPFACPYFSTMKSHCHSCTLFMTDDPGCRL